MIARARRGGGGKEEREGTVVWPSIARPSATSSIHRARVRVLELGETSISNFSVGPYRQFRQFVNSLLLGRSGLNFV